MAPPTSTPSARALADLTIGLGGHLVDELEEALADAGVTGTSFLALDALDRSTDGALGQGELVARVGRTPPLGPGPRPPSAPPAAGLAAALSHAAAVGAELTSWMTFFEPGERAAPRLGIAVAPAAVATRMRRAVGLEPHPGVLVLRVSRDGPAARAGGDRGDLVAGAGGGPVLSVGDLERAVLGAGKRVTLDLVRGAEPRTVNVDLD